MLNLGKIAGKPQIILYIIALSFITFATNAPAAQVTLAWDAVAGSDIAGYKMHYGTSSGHYSASIDTGMNTTCTIPNLISGATYFFAVAAYTSKGDQSGYSNEIAYTAPPEMTLASISIDGPTQVDENGNVQFNCTAHFSDGSATLLNSGVSWSENSAAATISPSGVLSAGSVNVDTAVTITAAYGNKTDTHTATIKNLPPTLESISISGPIQVSENSSTQFTCSALYSDGSSAVLTSNVTWSENSGAATITSTGKLSIGTVTSDTSLSVTAAYKGETDTHSVTIKKSAAVLASLFINGPALLEEGNSGQYSCIARYSDDSTSTVTDSVQWTVNSEFAVITASGYLTTRAVQSEEHAIITATIEGKQASYGLIIADSRASYTLNIDVKGAGAVLLDPPGGIYDQGAVVNVTAEPERAWAFDGWAGAVSDPESISTSVTMNSDVDLSVIFLEDTDLDSVPDQEEWGPDGEDLEFDGNGDGIADYLQGSVASQHTGDYRYYISLSTSEPGRLAMCRTLETDFIAGEPAEHPLSLGLVNLRIENIPIGAETALTIYLPPGLEVDTFYNFGPTLNDPIDRWYEFLYDQISETGAEIGGDTITVHFRDGSRGDNDLSANGAITLLGGGATLTTDPAPPGQQLSDDTPTISASSGGSGGCFIDTLFMPPR